MIKTLLLISDHPEDQVFASEAAKSAGLTLRKANDVKEGVSILGGDDPCVVIADGSTQAHYDAFENAMQETVGLFSDKANANQIHFISSGDLETCPYLVKSPLFGHFILRPASEAKEAGSRYGQVMKGTLAERAWGLEKLFKEGTKIQKIKLASSSQKQGAVEAVKSYLAAGKFLSRTILLIANAVDELLLNAIYDAPTDDLGKPTLLRTPRSTVIELQGKAEVEMQIGFDGTYLGVTVCDQHGSLEKDKLLRHLSTVYNKEEYKVKASVAGAGLGLGAVFHLGGSIFFASESRVRTEVTVFFKKSKNFRDFKDQFRFISTQFYL